MPRKEIIIDESMVLFEHYQLCYSAYRNSSFSPDRRAKETVRDYSAILLQDLQEIKKYNGDADRYKTSYIKKFVDWMSAETRTASSMITGPANFPVAKNRIALDRARARYEEFNDFRSRAKAAVKKKFNKAAKAKLDPFEEVQKKIDFEREILEKMKAANKINRSKKFSDVEKVDQILALGFTKEEVDEMLAPNHMGYTGFMPFDLSNCRARMKNAEAQKRELERRANAINKEEALGQIRMVDNENDNCFQLFFPDKPSADIRTLLKKNGFRWSGKNGCWQCYLSGKWKFQRNVLPTLKEL